ncbi:OmpA family protein [Chiayiivirga flava]|uniref:Outer membrane protein OmpA-like peptidoglycan-associated protein n=1 Tax=Chiayiivirga flava TaxID=659595 RepID=A0A7W8D965_9GAMM|nr:OmpA family protein [Chiayiivirga flava]MBB5209087.1 outer membrane protein OmpA-like peptidoglycan-associated protein [Chiayiivirga flava]
MSRPDPWKQCIALAAALAFAAVAAAADHPLVGRYAGAEPVGEFQSDYDEVGLIDGPIGGPRAAGAPGWITLEGKTSLHYYSLPAGRSTLEVLRNYESSLEARGFSIVFTCATSDGSCYANRNSGTAPYDFGNAFDASPELPRLNGDFIRNYFGNNARYLLAKLARPQGAVYAGIALSEHGRGNYAFVRVVETAEAMDTDMIRFVGAEEMRSTLADAGRISLYGVFFDTDRDVVKPDSARTIAEIARLLQADPALRVAVVGHTDAQGSAEHNLDLSERRARAVVRALTAQHGIAAGRLQARGAGMAEPVASNDDEQGRARNRRVELVRL